MSRYAVIIEGAGGNSYSAYVPDLPGCVAAGESIEEVESLIREGAQLHVASLREHGEQVPKPATAVTIVDIG
jgi:predicted RNase H-like HicB family nuclease